RTDRPGTRPGTRPGPPHVAHRRRPHPDRRRCPHVPRVRPDLQGLTVARRRRTPARRPGRPLLLPEVKDTLIKAVELGVPVRVACEAASISESAFTGWMQRGRDEYEIRGEYAEALAEWQ